MTSYTPVTPSVEQIALYNSRPLRIFGILELAAGVGMIICHSIANGLGITVTFGLGFYLGCLFVMCGPIIFCVGKFFVKGERAMAYMLLVLCLTLSVMSYGGALLVLLQIITDHDFTRSEALRAIIIIVHICGCIVGIGLTVASVQNLSRLPKLSTAAIPVGPPATEAPK
ncbi:uncharacterized protein LOC129595501 [Paramacrobiotus metropolitanus]|uniref:uncharacterized protein LOC129595501 n=1 Tax=Paramacrobiotus metropolitanus TaxID=2943436 RepID=UPI00244597A6|nr:uncharacterized protein LOC129595501 [Paramacrobiotus metropolitanus]